MQRRLEIVEYQTERDCLQAFFELMKGLYSCYPGIAEARFSEAGKNFNSKNPFLRAGSFSNFIALINGKAVAHATAIIDRRLPADIGLIGHFECIYDVEVAAQILARAEGFLRLHGKRTVRAPINFTTWQAFRVSYPELRPPFCFEPFTRDYYRHLFAVHGYSVVQKNVSTISALQDSGFDVFREDFELLLEKGMVFETMAQRGEGIMSDIYELTRGSFSDTWSFVPISPEEFSYTFRAASSLLDKDLVLVARDKDRSPVGFCFSLLDLSSEHAPRLVVKTLAVHPAYRGMGISKALLFLIHIAAAEKKCNAVIASTMRGDNRVIRNIIKTAEIYREYEVYEKNI